jgi:hypothetical protein
MAEPTRTDLYQYLVQLQVNATNDSLLDKCLARAKGLVNAYMRTRLKRAWTVGWADWAAASSKIVFAPGGDTLYLYPHQVGSVSLVQQSGITIVPQAYYEDPFSGDVYLIAQNPWFAADHRYPGYADWGRGPYSVTAIWGYGPMPDEVAQVELELAVNIWRGRDRGMWTDMINGAGGQYIKYTGGLTKQQEMVLESIADLWKVHRGSIEIQTENPRWRTDYRGDY